jgi:hypothetical protein
MSAFILAGVILATGVWVLLRFGVLSLATGFFVFMMIAQFPTTSDLSVWYSRGSLVVLTTVLALSVWAFRAALGGRKMWRDDLLDA